MIISTLRAIFRGFVRFKFYSVSTIVGFGTALTIGLISISFYVYEKQTDSFIDRSVYRILMSHPVSFDRQVITYHELAKKLKSDFPEIKETTHIYYPGYITLANKSRFAFKEKGAIYCDDAFFNIFDYRLIAGDVLTCLKNPNSLILTKDRALKYFGTLDVLNKVLTVDNENYTVTGVLDETPNNGHLKLSILLSYSSLSAPEDALDYGGFTYLKLVNNSTANSLENNLNRNKSELLSFKPAHWPEDPFKLEHISEIYYHKQYKESLFEIFRFRDKSTLNVYLIVSLVIFIVALVNFIIYFYSKTLSNSKQIAVKRIFGISDLSILSSFILEALVILLMSFCLGAFSSIFLIPLFNQWATSSIPLEFVLNFQVLLISFSIILSASLLIGFIFYYLFVRVPESVLFKGSSTASIAKPMGLKTLMIIQLTFSTTLLLLFFMIEGQFQKIDNYFIGYERNNLVEIDLSSFSPDSNPQTIKTEFLNNPNVVSGTVCFGGPMTGRWNRNITFNNKDADFGYYQVDSDFISVLGIKINTGKNFETYFSNDSSYLMVNETAADFFEIGNNIDSLRSDLPVSGKIIGVFKDFHYASLKSKVAPVFLLYVPYNKLGPFGGKLIVRLNHLDHRTLASLDSSWNKVSSVRPMEYSVLTDEYSKFYEDDVNESKILSISVMGILLVTSFGVIGFTYFSAQKRLKEMAIRKVLGASEVSIYTIWVKTLGVGIIIAFSIAIPVSFYLINEWSSDFVYKQPMTLSAIPYAALTLIIAVSLCSFYNIKQSTTKSISGILKQE